MSLKQNDIYNEMTAEMEIEEREQEKRDAFDILFNADLRQALAKTDKTGIFHTSIWDINADSYSLGVQSEKDYDFITNLLLKF